MWEEKDDSAPRNKDMRVWKQLGALQYALGKVDLGYERENIDECVDLLEVYIREGESK